MDKCWRRRGIGRAGDLRAEGARRRIFRGRVGGKRRSHRVGTKSAQKGTCVRWVTSEVLRTIRCMDRTSLEQLLGQGLSLAEIGRRFELHESTVGYWVEKHGLEAVNRDKHAARGGLEREQLEQLIGAGATIAEIADSVGRSKATVRHWLIRYGLKTGGGRGRRPPEAARAAKQVGLATVRMRCKLHGDTEFWLTSQGRYRCKRCRSDAVTRRRRKVKEILVEEAGGAVASAVIGATCVRCTSIILSPHRSDTR
jgi:transposase